MAAQSRSIFVNVPVKDLDASTAFFRALGLQFDQRFSDETAACMVLGEQAYVMLLVESRFADFVTKPVADAGAVTEAILGVSAESREEVDALADAALNAGATPSREPTDYGFMYARSFNDLDGHLWEVIWMSPEAIEQRPPDMAQPA